MTPPPTGRAVDLPCRVCPFFDPFGSGLPVVEVEGREPFYLDPNLVSFSWGFMTERDSAGNARPPFFAPAPAAGRSNLLDADGTRAFFEKVWRDHGRDGRVVGVLEGGRVVVASGELLLVVPSWCVVLKELAASDSSASRVSPTTDHPLPTLPDPLDVQCPYPGCRAEERKLCKNPQTGAKRTSPHPSRASLAREQGSRNPSTPDPAADEAADDVDAEGEIFDPDRRVSLHPSDVLAVACPRKRCGAEPGEPCLSVDGTVRHSHPVRWRVAILRKKEGLAVEAFAKELSVHVMNEGRRAASQGRGRSENPHDYSSSEEAARRTAWDAGWIYVAGPGRLREAVAEQERRLSIEQAQAQARAQGSAGGSLPPPPTTPHLQLTPLSIDCPLEPCGAKAGEPCRKLAGDGGPRTKPHPARCMAAGVEP